MCVDLVSLASTSFYIFLDVVSHIGPPIISADGNQCSLSPRMTSRCMVMILVHQVLSESSMRNVQLILVIQEIVFPFVLGILV
jgi:hypothetical protein